MGIGGWCMEDWNGDREYLDLLGSPDEVKGGEVK